MAKGSGSSRGIRAGNLDLGWAILNPIGNPISALPCWGCKCSWHGAIDYGLSTLHFGSLAYLADREEWAETIGGIKAELICYKATFNLVFCRGRSDEDQFIAGGEEIMWRRRYDMAIADDRS